MDDARLCIIAAILVSVCRPGSEMSVMNNLSATFHETEPGVSNQVHHGPFIVGLRHLIFSCVGRVVRIQVV